MILYRATRVGPHALFCGDSETGDESSALGVGVGVEKRCKTDGGRYTCQDNFGFPSRIPSFNGHFRMGRMLAESTNTWHASVRRPRPWRHNTIELKSTELRSSRSLYYRTKPLSRTYLYVFVCDVTRFTHFVTSRRLCGDRLRLRALSSVRSLTSWCICTPLRLSPPRTFSI